MDSQSVFCAGMSMQMCVWMQPERAQRSLALSRVRVVLLVCLRGGQRVLICLIFRGLIRTHFPV